MMSENGYFDRPSVADLGGGGENQRYIDYAAGKTPEMFAGTEGLEEHLRQNGKLGLYTYDREKQHNIPLEGGVLVLLGVSAQVKGAEVGSKGAIRYWSNLVSDSRTEAFRVFSSEGNREIAHGLWKDIRGGLPSECKFRVVFRLLSPDFEDVFWMPLTALLDAGLKVSIANSLEPPVPVGRVRYFGMAERATWAFRHTGYARCDKDGADWTPGRDLFFRPVFECGLIGADHPLREMVERVKMPIPYPTGI